MGNAADRVLCPVPHVDGADHDHLQIKTVNANGEGVTYTDIEVAVGQTLPVTVTLPSAITRIELYICSTTTVPAGSYTGSFTVTAPQFTVSES